MTSSELKNAIRVGKVKVNPNPPDPNSKKKKKSAKPPYYAYPTSLMLEYDANFPKIKTKRYAIVYFILVNDVVYKIGQTSNSTGISGCVAGYMNAGMDDAGPNRFTINYLMRDELKKGNKIEFYMLYEKPIKVEITTMLGVKKMVESPVDAKNMEVECIKEYRSLHNNKLPIWNYQESSKTTPQQIAEAYGNYKSQRAKAKAP